LKRRNSYCQWVNGHAATDTLQSALVPELSLAITDLFA
jgi:hypothetical protein